MTAADQKNFLFKDILGSIALLAPWLMLLYQLSINWSTSEQYSHGYLVPFLSIYLFLKTKPADNEAINNGKLFIFFGIPLILFLFPVWIIRGANSDWRLVNFTLYITIASITVIHAIDNGGWPKVKNLLFPLAFFLVAIPWPLSTDLKLTLWFQEKVSSIIVDTLLILEHDAKLQGTIIDIGHFGQIGVDQACSGIQGLQASVVVTLFLGAYYYFSPIHRLVFTISGILVAVAVNLGRAFVLSFIKVKGKGELLDQPLLTVSNWQSPTLHDLAGWIETGLIFIVIFFLARAAKGGLFLHTMGSEKTAWSNINFRIKPIFSIFTIGFVILTTSASEYYYHSKEKKMQTMPKLSINLNDKDLLNIEQSISRQIASQLHFEKAFSTQFQDRFRCVIGNFGNLVINPNDEYWQAFEARWDSGGACTAVLSTHSPESCLPLTGLAQINPAPGQDPILVPIKIGGREVLFEAYEFSRNYRKLFVFRCFWPYKLAEEQPNLFPRGGYSFDGRIQSALQGRRNVGGTMLALALANVDSSQTAIAKLQVLANQRLFFE